MRKNINFIAFKNFGKKKFRFQKNSVGLIFGCPVSPKINPIEIVGS